MERCECGRPLLPDGTMCWECRDAQLRTNGVGSEFDFFDLLEQILCEFDDEDERPNLD